MKWMKSKITQESLEKIAEKYDVKIVKTAQFGNVEAIENCDPPVLYETNTKEASENHIPIEGGRFIDLAGLQSTSASFSNLLNPICKYAFARILDDLGTPLFFTSNNFSKYPGTCEISVDVDKTETVVNDACVVFQDKILTIAESYGTVSINCYAKSKKDTKSFISGLNKKMSKENQYRGKCLFFSEDNIIFRDTPTVAWDDVVMEAKNKNEIKINTVDFLTNKKFAELGINRRGLILYGPPGTGKTMMVKSLFNQMNDGSVTRIYATADTFTYPAVVTQLFDFLKFAGKTVLAFEDMDLISPERSDGSGRKVLGALLNNLDGIRKMEEPLVVIGTTNDITMIDKALANRPCRFDRKIEVPLPGEEQVKTFFSMLMGSSVTDEIISLSKGFSGAHIKEAVNTAKLLAAQTDLDTSSCLKDACTIIRENFFPMTKEATKTLYKNKEGNMKKEAQVALITPFITNPMGDYNFIPLMQFFKKSPEFSNKEATSMWKIWKNHEGQIDNNKITINESKYSDAISTLTKKELMQGDGNGKYALTDKGKKLLRSIILTTEVNSFEKNASEPEEINMETVDKKIHGGTSKKVKKASIKNKKIEKDWYFNAVRDIQKD